MFCIESVRNMHLNFVNHVIIICKQDLHLRTGVSCLGIGITIILYNKKIIQFTVLHAYSCYLVILQVILSTLFYTECKMYN